MKRFFAVLFLIISFILSAEIIIDEDFTGTFPPAGWTTTGGTNWQQGTGNYAGGVAPEARFYWSPSATSVFRLISQQIDTTGGTTLQLSFRHYVDHFSDTYTLKVQTTSDGTNWNDVWSINPTGDVGPEMLDLTVTTPDVGSQSFQIAWVFDGYTWNINNWYVDDIFLEGQLIVYDNDLAGMAIVGNTNVNAGNSEIYDISVKNVGNNSQSSYNVKLFKDNIEVASLDVNEPIAPEQTVVHSLVWQIPGAEPSGTKILYGKVTLTGDENTANDNTPNLSVNVFPPGISQITVGDGTILWNRTPVRFQYLNSLTEMLYFPDEFNFSTGMIVDITFYSNFIHSWPNENITVWLGETNLQTLTDGWIPSTDLTQVFDGYVSFPIGQNQITITLETPYFYEGNNLVLMMHRPMSGSQTGDDNFYHDETLDHIDRTRYEADNTMVLDPANPPVGWGTERFPNTTFSFLLGSMGEVEGYVYDDLGTVLTNAQVVIEELQMTTYSDNQGFYHFGNVLVGTYDFTASKFGYSPQTIQGEVLEDQTTTIDFNLPPLGIVTVNGQVVGSDFPEIGLAGAQVSVTGFANYAAITDDNGDFEISGVYTNITYDLSISHEGYNTLDDEMVVGAVNLDLGTLILQEITIPPGNVQATQNLSQTQVDLIWNSPGQGGGEFRYDDGEVDFQIGFSNNPANGVFGAVHPNIAIIQEVQWFLRSIYGAHSTVKILILGLDEDNYPDVNQVYLITNNVPNIDDEWNSLILDDEISAPEGFFVGVITPGLYTSVGLDDGEGEPWIFQPGTQLSNENWLTGNNWEDIGSVGMFQRNMMIRAYGINMGYTDSETAKPANSAGEFPADSSREFESYNIYRFPFAMHNYPTDWDLIASSVIDTFHTDNTWASLPVDTYQFAVTSIHTNGVESLPAFSQAIQKTMVYSQPGILPTCTSLFDNYPNPFNPTTTIKFDLSENGGNTYLAVFNLKGQKVKTLVNEILTSGFHSVIWDGTDDNGRKAASGLYLYKLQTAETEISKKMLLLK